MSDILTDEEKQLIYRLFWPKGYVHWVLLRDNTLRSTWPSGSEVTVVSSDSPDREARSQAAMEYAIRLERGMRALLEGAGE